MEKDRTFVHLGILVLLLLISVNLIILDYKIFYPGNFLAQNTLVEAPIIVTPGITDPSPLTAQCPLPCLDIIRESTTGSKIGSSTPVSTAIANTSLPLKEYFIPLGNGTTSKNDWDNIVTTETVIDPRLYGKIEEAFLLVTLKNPTQNGQVETRLYNVTDNYPIFGSHIVMSGKTEQTISSQKFALPGTSKLYRLQLKSTLSFPASLDNARLKLLTR